VSQDRWPVPFFEESVKTESYEVKSNYTKTNKHYTRLSWAEKAFKKCEDSKHAQSGKLQVYLMLNTPDILLLCCVSNLVESPRDLARTLAIIDFTRR